MNAKPQYIGFVLLSLGVFALAGCSGEAKKARHLERAQAQFKAGDYDSAEIEYLSVLRLDPTNRVAIRDLGIMAYDQGRIPRAFTLLDKLKTADTNDLEVRLPLGLSELALGGAQKARREAVFVLDHQPTNGQAMLLLVDSSLSSNDLADAQQRLDELNTMASGIPGFHLARGGVALRHGDLDSAAASFRQALRLDPKSSTAHFAMANLYLLQHDRTNAETEFRVAAESSPTRSTHWIRYANFIAATGDTNAAVRMLEEISRKAPDYLPALLRQAEFALAGHEFEKCEELLRSVLQRDQTNLDAMKLTAQLRAAQGDLAKSLAELDRAIKAYPRLPELHYRKGATCLVNNDLPGAVNSLNQALALEPNYAEAAMLLAEINIRKGDLDSAITSLQALLQNRPGFTPARLLLANAYRARGNLDDALGIYQDLAQIFTNSAQPVLLAGLVQRQQGKTVDARQSFVRALELSPDSVAALQQLVGMDLDEKHFAAASNRVQQAMERRPEAPELLVLLARVYLAGTNQPGAEAALLKAVELAPDSPGARQMLTDIYVASNRYQDALNTLQETVSRNPNDITSWSRIAYFQTAISNYTAAQAAYEKVLALDPKSRDALNNLALLYSEHLGDLDRAYELANKARAAHLDDPYVSDTLGWICYRRGEYARAVQLLKLSAAKLSNEPDVLFHLGMTHYMLGEEAAAKVALQSALQLGHDGPWRNEAEARLQVLATDPATADAQAVQRLEKRLTEHPDEPPVLVRIAAVREREGSWEEAAAAYEASLKVNPNLVSSLVSLAQLDSLRLNKTQEGLELARQAHNLSPQNPTITHVAGKLAYQAADYQWAYSLLHESASRLPDDPGVLFDYAWASCAVGKMSDAVEVMEKVVQMGSSSSQAVQAAKFLKMNALLANPSEAEAEIAEVHTLLEADPDHLPALMVTGLIQERKGEFKAARDTYEHVLKRYPLFSPALKCLARLYFDPLQDPAKAYDYAVRAHQALPQDAAVGRMLGLIEYDRGDYLRAAQLLVESAGSFPKDAELQYRLGMAQHRLNANEDSKRALTKALELAPDSPLAVAAKRILAELE